MRQLGLWAGNTYPKFGIYRGKKDCHNAGGDSNVFELWIYCVQISDASLDEMSVASGIGTAAGKDTACGASIANGAR